MQEITIHDKTFVESISTKVLQQRINELAEELKLDYAGRDPLVVSVLNGAFLFTADLARAWDSDPEIQFVRVSSYEGGMQSTGRMRVLLDVDTSVEDRDILVVEDIVDTGRTLEWLRKHLFAKGAKSVSLITLLYKEEAFIAETPPEYVGFNIPNEFVVGYGMDYAERGRSLESIYTLKV